MASFYGPGIGSGEGGGASVISNYNSLINVPIINKTGSQSAPINLSDLNYGNYNIIGYYTDNGATATYAEAPFFVSVGNDKTTGEKVAVYQEVIGGQIVMTIVTEDSVDKILIGAAADQTDHAMTAEQLVLLKF